MEASNAWVSVILYSPTRGAHLQGGVQAGLFDMIRPAWDSLVLVFGLVFWLVFRLVFWRFIYF